MDEEDRPCDEEATCHKGGTIHCRMWTRYPEVFEEGDDGCCVVGCPLDVDEVNVR